MKTFGIIIIGLVVTFFMIVMILPYFMVCTDKPRWSTARSKMAPIETAIESYKLNTGKLPEKLEDLIYCPDSRQEVWKGPYLKKVKQLHDPWDNPYVYEINPNDPNSYVLISYGADGELGGEGFDSDIYND